MIIIEEECPKILRRGWAAMIRKVYEVSPLVCPKCQGRMSIIAFITDCEVIDRIIDLFPIGINPIVDTACPSANILLLFRDNIFELLRSAR